MLAKVRGTIDWMRVWFAVSLAVFLITSSLFLYAPWGIGGAMTKGSWQYDYWHTVNSAPMAWAICASFFAVAGFAIVFRFTGRRVLAAIALAAVLLGLVELVTL